VLGHVADIGEAEQRIEISILSAFHGRPCSIKSIMLHQIQLTDMAPTTRKGSRSPCEFLMNSQTGFFVCVSAARPKACIGIVSHRKPIAWQLITLVQA